MAFKTTTLVYSNETPENVLKTPTKEKNENKSSNTYKKE